MHSQALFIHHSEDDSWFVMTVVGAILSYVYLESYWWLNMGILHMLKAKMLYLRSIAKGSLLKARKNQSLSD